MPAEDLFSTSFDSHHQLIWNTSDIREVESCLEPVSPSFSVNRHRAVDFIHSPLGTNLYEPPSPNSNNENRTNGPKQHQKDQIFVCVKPDTFQNTARTEDLQDGSTPFQNLTNVDVDTKVHNWQTSIQSNTYIHFQQSAVPVSTLKSTPITKAPYNRRRRTMTRKAASPCRSIGSVLSKVTPSEAASPASDSTFAPDILDISSFSSLSLEDDFQSPVSSSLKRRRGRPSKNPPRKRNRNSIQRTRSAGTGVHSTKLIKKEPTYRRRRRGASQKMETSTENYENYWVDFGWEYSEYDDLAPVNQIADMCENLPLDPVFHPLRYFRF